MARWRAGDKWKLDADFLIMKTLSNLMAANCTDDGRVATVLPALTRKIKGKTIGPIFQRQFRETAAGWYAESSSGAKVFIARSEMMKMIEAHDPLFCVPKTV